MVKVPRLLNEPARFFTTIFPVTAPLGTRTLICAADTTVIVVVTPTPGPPKSTSLTLERFVPLIVTVVTPILPLVGEKELIVGGLITIKSRVLVPVPDGVT